MRLAVLLCVIGCGGGGGTSTAPDAMPDAPVPVITLASCPSVVDVTIQDSPTMFIPKETTLGRGGIAKFVITSEHFVIPNTLVNTDPALNVARGETKCFKFMVTGTYGFLCGVHGFTGTITIP
jgi:plastocyanin